MYFLSGKRTGILIRRKSWMHFASSCSGVIFSLAGFLFPARTSRGPVVRTRSRSVLLGIGVGPFFTGRSKVWMLAWRVTGRTMTVSWGELASDWVSEQEVESSLREVPLSPSRSLLWLLQQQSQWEEDHPDGPPFDDSCLERKGGSELRSGVGLDLLTNYFFLASNPNLFLEEILKPCGLDILKRYVVLATAMLFVVSIRNKAVIFLRYFSGVGHRG